MNSIRKNFRKWWQVPRRASDRIDHRTVTFLELFYDLVYVVIIAELAHALAAHPDLNGIGSFVFLFTIVWWAWINGTSYHDLHGNNDIRTRVFTFMQMFAVAAMAVFAHNAMDEGAVGFALSYAAFQLILTFLWWRTGVHDEEHRPFSKPYITMFLISTALFIASVFVPAPWRFVMWGVGIIITITRPLKSAKQLRADQKNKEGFNAFITASGVERFGLFTIVVLGEVIVGVVQGVAAHHGWDWLIGATAGLGMLIAIGLWWVYFDFVSNRMPLPGGRIVMGWLYLHLPMTMSMAAVGAGVLTVIEHAGEHLSSDVRWLLVGSSALALVCIALLKLTVQAEDLFRPLLRRGSVVALVSAALIVLTGFLDLDAPALLGLIAILLLAPIIYGFQFWIRRLIPTE